MIGELEQVAAPQDRISRRRAGGNGSRRRADPPSDRRPGRRTGPHQRTGQPHMPSAIRMSRNCSGPASTSSPRSTSSISKACTTWSNGPPACKVKERIPDYVLAMADQIVNVDLSAEDLRERLTAGKIYPAERVESGARKLLHRREPDPAARDDARRNRPSRWIAAAASNRANRSVSAPIG